MTLEIPLILFGLFLVSAILAVVLLIVTGAREAFRIYNTSRYTWNQPSWGHIIAYFLGIIFVILANIGWWGGWITLVIWAVLKLA